MLGSLISSETWYNFKIPEKFHIIWSKLLKSISKSILAFFKLGRISSHWWDADPSPLSSIGQKEIVMLSYGAIPYFKVTGPSSNAFDPFCPEVPFEHSPCLRTRHIKGGGATILSVRSEGQMPFRIPQGILELVLECSNRHKTYCDQRMTKGP